MTLDFAALDAGLAPKGRFSRAVFRRLFLDRLLPETYARYVAIDSDMLIARPGLARLTEFDLGGHAFAAAYDMIFLMDHKGGPLAREFQGYRRALGLELDTPYFNAGLMTIDRAAWRKAGLAERGGGARCARRRERFPFMEQDALNSLVRGRFRAAEPALQFHGRFLPHRARSRDRADRAAFRQPAEALALSRMARRGAIRARLRRLVRDLAVPGLAAPAARPAARRASPN